MILHYSNKKKKSQVLLGYDEIKQKDNLPWAILVLVVVFVALMIIIAVLNARK